MDFGPPSLAASLVDGAASKLPAGCSWVALPPDSLTSARLAAGQVVLVGITGRVVQPPALGAGGGGLSSPAATAPGRSPGTPLGPTSCSFGPAPELLAPDPRTGLPPQPLSLWRLCGGRLGLPASSGLGDAGAGASVSHDNGAASSQTPAPPPGAFLLPARVWPSTKLPRSCALISPALRESAGQPPAGTVVLLYRLSAVGAASPAAPGGAGLATPAKSAAAAAASGEAAAANGAGAGISGGAGCGAAVVLRLCAETLLQAGAGQASAGAGSGSGDVSSRSESGGTPASRIGTPAGKGSRGAGGGGGGGGGLPGRSPAAASPAPARGTPAAATAVGDAVAGGGGVGGPLQQWPLDTLRSAADAGDEAARTALAAVARRHLAGRHVMAGAPLVLPVLGSSVLFRVAAAAPPSYGSGAGAAAAATAAVTPVEVGRDTQVVVLYPGEAVPEQFAAFAVGPGEAAAGPAATADSVARRVAVAREAAAAAVAESAAEAAADAAERALLAGLSSGGVDFSHLGGVGPHLRSLRELVSMPLRAPHLFAQYGIRPPRGVLLYGPPGSGKTMLARAAAADAGATVFLINGPDVVSEYYGESESSLRGIFAAASALAPSLVLMDEVDALAPARPGGGGSSAHTPGATSGGSDVASRLVTALLTLLDGADEQQQGQQQQPQQQQPQAPWSLGAATAPPAAPCPSTSAPARSSYRPVVVVAATNRPDALDAALRRPGRLERELEVGVPGAAARLEVLQARLRRVRHCLSGPQVASLAASAHGFVAADLAALVDEAAMCGLRRRVADRGRLQEAGGCDEGPAVVSWEDFKMAETRVRPSALREVAVDVPAVRWDDIGGMQSVKQALREAVEWPTKAASAMSRLGAQPPRGVLLYGPPGCSKTLLARAVACEAGLNFIAVKGGELAGKYVGESEKAVAGLFARARATSPSIIFFDELDGLVGSRGGPGEAGSAGGGGGGVSERLLSQMLTEMDGLKDRGGVTVLAATNRPDCLDPALLRPGRFDRLIHVPLPDRDARKEILRVQLRRCPVAPDVDVGVIAVRTAGYSGADLAAVVREAGLAALEEDLGAELVAMRHFESALGLVGPSVEPSFDMMAVYGNMQRAAVPVSS